MDGTCCVCFCCPHSAVKHMNVRIFWVHVMECLCAWTRPQFRLSSKRVLENEIRTHVNSKGNIPSTGGSEEDRTHSAPSRKTASPTHYWLSYSGPLSNFFFLRSPATSLVFNILGRFLPMWPFLHLTIEVVTFRLQGSIVHFLLLFAVVYKDVKCVQVVLTHFWQ